MMFLIALNSILNPQATELPAPKHSELQKRSEKNNHLTPEILDAIYELENSQFEIFEKPKEYSTRFYRITADTPRIIEVLYYKPDNSVDFLQHNHHISNHTDFSSIHEFLYKNPEQQILVPLSALAGNYFSENAYFYRPDGYVPALVWACHGGRACYPKSIYYSLDERKIIDNDALSFRRETILKRPPIIKTPAYPKTKP